MSAPDILVEYRGDSSARTATVIISNPTELNALTTHMQIRIAEVLDILEADAAVRGVIIRGAGTKAFSVGGSMDSLAEIKTREDGEALHQRGYRMRETILKMKKPVIAAVSGWCIGGGFELALACDLIYASETARFGMTEVDMGLVPGWGGALDLPRRTNLIRAKEMLLLGTRLPAQQAQAEGIVNRVFPDDSLFDEVDRIMDTIAQKPPLAVQGIKQVFRVGALDTGFEDAGILAHELSVSLMDTHDFHEAVDAFQNKRPPKFEGR